MSALLRNPLLRAVFAAVVLLAAAGGAYLFRQAPANRRVIDERGYVTIGGIAQYVAITGESRANPILLFVHGGPGRSMLGFADAFRPWEKYFTVVQWDQRGTGRTYLRGGAGQSGPLTIARMTQDGIELAQYLARHLHGKVIVVGHSWGSILGVRMAQARPDLFSAYVGTGQFVDKAQAEPVLYAALLAKARAAHDAQTVAQLQSLPVGAARRSLVTKLWAERYALQAERDLKSRLNRAAMVGAGASSAEDRNAVRAAIRLSVEQLSPQMADYDIRATGLDFAVPFVLIQGEEDSQMPALLARQYFAAVHAPAKAYVPLKGGGHFAVVTMSGDFLRVLVETVRPLAMPKAR